MERPLREADPRRTCNPFRAHYLRNQVGPLFHVEVTRTQRKAERPLVELGKASAFYEITLHVLLGTACSSAGGFVRRLFNVWLS